MPRPNSRAGGGPLRPHSRNSSSTKLGANLQFTTSTGPNPANVPPAKKSNAGAAQQQTAYTGTGAVHEANRPAVAPFARPASSQRVHSHSREQIARRLVPLQQYPPARTGSGKNFSLHASKKPSAAANANANKGGRNMGAEDEDEDDDEWESSESGAATPNQQSGSDTASDEGPDPAVMNVQIPDDLSQQQQQQAQLQALLHQQHLLQQQQAQQQAQQQQQAQYQQQYQQQQYEQQLLQQKRREEAELHEYLQQRHAEAQRQQKQEQERYFLQQQQQQQQQPQHQQQQYQQQQQQQQNQQQQIQQQQYQHQLYLQQKQLQQEQYLQQLQQQQQRQHPTQQQQYQLQQQQQQFMQSQHPPQVQTGFDDDSQLTRVNTARPSDFEQPSGRAQAQQRTTPRPASPRHQPPQQQQQQQYKAHQPQRQQAYPTEQQPSDRRPQAPRTTSNPNPIPSRPSVSTAASDAHHSAQPCPASRPPSNQSMRSDRDHPTTTHLRPHPLFRGISHGPPNPLPKPTPLAPLTVLPASSGDDHDGTVVTASPTISAGGGGKYQMQMSTSPTGTGTGSGSPGSVELAPAAFGVVGVHHNHNHPNNRRLSFSSARSSATLPPGSARESAWTHERTRTLSTMSATSSSAALSSLVNLPGNLMSPSPSAHFNSNSSNASNTRPPSPSALHLQQHFNSQLSLGASGAGAGGYKTVVYFPQTNPNVNVEAIHPLLPVPYLQNHLTVLERCTPLRESWERVVKAKNAVRSA